uniref:Homeobox domain-containing protein n=1 Tax=Parascaris equorum TaxID=6256 RepID=A0A914S6B6_PAREQ
MLTASLASPAKSGLSPARSLSSRTTSCIAEPIANQQILNFQQPSSIKTDIFGRDEDDCWDSSTLTSLDMHMASTPPLSLHSPKSDETTRVRTVLNEKQLMTLKTCYAANARLSARVIRVWFQNKRCKDKKRQIAMKHMQQKAETVIIYLEDFVA